LQTSRYGGTMETMRESWTDERLDDLNQRVELGFEQVDKRFEQVDRRFEQVDRRFEQVDQRFEQVEKSFGMLHTDMNRIHDRLDGMYRILIQFCGATFAALVTLVAAVVGLAAI
jgi:archaellum component FlaC